MSSHNGTHTPSSSTDSFYPPRRLSYFYTDFTEEELSIFTPYISTTPLIVPDTPSDPLLNTILTPATITTPQTVDRPIATTPIPPNPHQYPPSDSHIFTIAATLGRVTLGHANITIPDYPNIPVFSITRPPKTLIRPEVIISNSLGNFRIDHEVKRNAKVALYECQDMDTAHTRVILAVPTRWTHVQNSPRWVYICRKLLLSMDRLVHSLAMCIGL
jgi:hypothetical protein